MTMYILKFKYIILHVLCYIHIIISVFRVSEKVKNQIYQKININTIIIFLFYFF